MKRVLFACTTPYQVMGAVSIADGERLTADLLIFGMFDGYEELAERIRDCGLFRDVMSVAPDRYKTPGRKGAMKQMLFARSVTRRFLPEDRVYDTYYSSSRAHIKNILLHELIRRNRKLKIVIYEDGMGTYDRDSHVLNTTGTRRRAERLLGWDLYRPERMTYQVYEPSLFTRPKGCEACEVKRMPKPGDREETRRLTARIFRVTPAEAIREKVIIFDLYRGGDRERDQILPVIDRCYEEIIDAFGRDRVIIKPHPRSLKQPETEARLYAGAGIPMEALYAEMEDLQDRILVTYASTAVYTPRMLFGREPRVIALFRIADGESGSQWQTQFDKFRSLYAAPERMRAPASEVELKTLLAEIRAEA